MVDEQAMNSARVGLGNSKRQPFQPVFRFLPYHEVDGKRIANRKLFRTCPSAARCVAPAVPASVPRANQCRHASRSGYRSIGQRGSSRLRELATPTLDHALIRLSIPFAAPTDPEPSAGYAIQVQDHAPVFMDVLTNLCSSSEILSGGRTKSTQPEA